MIFLFPYLYICDISFYFISPPFLTFLLSFSSNTQYRDDGQTIDIDEFEVMMKEAGLLGDDLTYDTLSTCFLKSQEDNFSISDTSDASEGQLTFDEFMEAIARVACEKWTDMDMDVKLNIMVETLREIS